MLRPSPKYLRHAAPSRRYVRPHHAAPLIVRIPLARNTEPRVRPAPQQPHSAPARQPQSCPPMYKRIIFSQYGQSWDHPSQMRSALPIPLLHRIPDISRLFE